VVREPSQDRDGAPDVVSLLAPGKGASADDIVDLIGWNLLVGV
jgi:hypothetical protein